LQHFGCETLGAIAEALRSNQIEWEYVSLADRHGGNLKLDDADGLIVLGGPLSESIPVRPI
jgi:GMP synthase-like glutamine amidotransferase